MRLKNKYERAFEHLKELANYDNVDDLVVLKELVERSADRSVKSVCDGYGDSSIPNGVDEFCTCVCPKCEEEIVSAELEPNYCQWCGQALEWSNNG